MRFIYNLTMGKAISFTIGEPAGAFAGGILHLSIISI